MYYDFCSSLNNNTEIVIPLLPHTQKGTLPRSVKLVRSSYINNLFMPVLGKQNPKGRQKKEKITLRPKEINIQLQTAFD